jgi:Toastrack DUF4097
MKLRLGELVGLFIIILLFTGNVMASAKVESHSFSNVSSLNIELLTGSLEIQKGDQDKVVVLLRNELPKPEVLITKIEVVDGTLVIKESTGDQKPNGKTFWTLLVPSDAKFESIICQSALGDIDCIGLQATTIDCKAASGYIAVDSLQAGSLMLSTTTAPLTVRHSIALESAEMVSADGDLFVELLRLPANRLKGASTTGKLRLEVPDFGENFQLSIKKNAGQGKVISPFECTNKETRKFNENDLYSTDICTVIRGKGGPAIDLLTGSGLIQITTDENRRADDRTPPGSK